jgi:hypothetical protein
MILRLNLGGSEEKLIKTYLNPGGAVQCQHFGYPIFAIKTRKLFKNH